MAFQLLLPVSQHLLHLLQGLLLLHQLLADVVQALVHPVDGLVLLAQGVQVLLLPDVIEQAEGQDEAQARYGDAEQKGSVACGFFTGCQLSLPAAAVQLFTAGNGRLLQLAFLNC